ncbi:hypothetical protein [Kitasatospora sp. NPDC018619]|uniref:hypothetical protein n=1 Tax=unclassified Kitasatospora TaxID=2633591 RepID=UPI00379E12D6
MRRTFVQRIRLLTVPLAVSLLTGLAAVSTAQPSAAADTPAVPAVNDFKAATFGLGFGNSDERWATQVANLAADNDVVALQEVPDAPYRGYAASEKVLSSQPYTDENGQPGLLRTLHYDWNPSGTQPLHVYKLTTQGRDRAVALVTRVPATSVISLPQDGNLSNFRAVLGADLTNANGRRAVFYSLRTTAPGGTDGPGLVEQAAAKADGAQWAVLGGFEQEPTWSPTPAGARIVAGQGNTYDCTTPAPAHKYDYMVTNSPDPLLTAAAVPGVCSGRSAVQVKGPLASCGNFGASSTPCAPPSSNAARSTSVSLQNRTGCNLVLEQRDLPHGIWTYAAPAQIGRDQSAAWASESNGILTGTEASVRYTTASCLTPSNDNRQVKLHWDNPYAGANSYDEAGSDRSAFKITREGGVGNNATVYWTVQQKPLAIVSMGDSYMSGEAGRWAGNGNGQDKGSAFGTDRSSVDCNANETGCRHDLTKVYGSTSYEGGNRCDRSDVSEIAGAVVENIPPERRFNLACSGAVTDNVLQSTFKGEAPQIQQLQTLAQNYNVRLVALSIGGNDLDFSGVVTACASAFMLGRAHCAPGMKDEFAARLPAVEDKVVATLNAVHTTMGNQGYDRKGYRLVSQSYPAPLARGNTATDTRQFRYPGEGYERQNDGGCPFYNEDATWARDTVIPSIATMLKSAARRADAFSLDLQDAINGHELCRYGTSQAVNGNTLANPLPAEKAEWSRWVPTVLPWGGQGDRQEAIHPNAFGQKAMSSCLSQASVQMSTGGREFACRSSAGSATPSLQTVTTDPNYLNDSVNRAAAFLAAAQDRTGSVIDVDHTPPPVDPITGLPLPVVPAQRAKLGVPSSYMGGHFGPGATFGPDGYQSSFTYDNALVVYAFLTQGGDGVARARTLGDSLLYAQDHDPVNDGRIRASYLPNPFITTLGRDYPVGTPYIGGWSVYTGNMAWAGMAFCQLYKATGDSRYLNGALRAANWIQTNSADDRGAGGYTGGFADTSPLENGSGMVKRTWKATEHNIDVGAFFTMLNQQTGDQVWKDRADRAFAFVKSMVSADSNHLWTGTGLDGVSLNEDSVPADVQVWAYLATLDPAYSRTSDWAAGRMAATDGPVDPATGQKMFKGISFGTADVSGVWFEGTAHLLAVYQTRKAPGDAEKAAELIATLQRAQNHAENTDGTGIVAASHDGLQTGQGKDDLYYSALHTGATAWYVAAAKGGNPFRL